MNFFYKMLNNLGSPSQAEEEIKKPLLNTAPADDDKTRKVEIVIKSHDSIDQNFLFSISLPFLDIKNLGNFLLVNISFFIHGIDFLKSEQSITHHKQAQKIISAKLHIIYRDVLQSVVPSYHEHKLDIANVIQNLESGDQPESRLPTERIIRYYLYEDRQYLAMIKFASFCFCTGIWGGCVPIGYLWSRDKQINPAYLWILVGGFGSTIALLAFRKILQSCRSLFKSKEFKDLALAIENSFKSKEVVYNSLINYMIWHRAQAPNKNMPEKLVVLYNNFAPGN